MVWEEKLFPECPRQAAGHSPLPWIARGTTPRFQGGSDGQQDCAAAWARQAQARIQPRPAPPTGTRQEPDCAPRRSGCCRGPGASLRPFPLSPPRSPSRTQLPGARRAACSQPGTRTRFQTHKVAHLSCPHPRTPTSSPCPRPPSCSPRFRRSPPPSHHDGSSPSYPHGNALAFSSRAVASHSRRPARPLPLQCRARLTPRHSQRPSPF